jgi:hypothetical protein
MGVILALVGNFGLATPVPAIEQLLHVLPNLAAVVWLVGVYTLQSPRLGRLGTLGLSAASVSLTAIVIFDLLSLGFDLVLLYLFYKSSSTFANWGRPVVVLGGAALYFFLSHWFLNAAFGVFQGGLPQTYLAWVIGLILLYPICKTYEAFKHRMPATSIWRMI